MKQMALLFCATLPLITTMTHAAENDNNCGKLNIVISNATSEPCRLVSSNLIHGYLTYTSSIPMFIPPNASSSPTFLTQGLFGPELELTYSCGSDRQITINSQQNFCFLSGGKINGTVMMARNMFAEYQIQEGSFFWSQHGNIQWQLK